MAATFLYTQGKEYQDPKKAKAAVGLGYPDLTRYWAKGACILKPDHVLFAMGDTEELSAAFKKAKSGGHTAFECPGKTLAIGYVRTKVKDPESRLGADHTVTLLSVATTDYWGGSRLQSPWRDAQTGSSPARSIDEFLTKYIPAGKGVSAFV
jgi:hypothetical protein